MFSQKRGSSPIPFVIFLLLWLVSCYFAYTYNEQKEKAQRRLVRKKISALKLGQTVPGLKRERVQLDLEIRQIKKVLGYLPDGRQLDTITVDNVIRSATVKLNSYHDNALPRGSDDEVTIFAEGKKKVSLRINGESVQVPIFGLRHQDKLLGVRYALNLESVLTVLRLVSARLGLHRQQVQHEIAQLENRLVTIEARSSKKQALVSADIRKNERTLVQHTSDRTQIKANFAAQISSAKSERSVLAQQIQKIDKRIQRTHQTGEKEVQTLENLIRQANRIKRRRLLMNKKLKRRRKRYATREALLASTVDSDKPDGEIVSASAKHAWINLGRRDKVQPGMLFFVYTPTVGDFWAYRAKIQVLRVQAGIAKCRMIEVKDQFEPVTAGDKIFNKVYRTPREVTLRSERQRVAFIGRFPRSRKRLPFIKNMLRRLDARIDERLTHFTTLVIVESGFENDPAFIKATRELNIEVLTLAQLREFIAY